MSPCRATRGEGLDKSLISIGYQSTGASKSKADGDGGFVASLLSVFIGNRIAERFTSRREFVRISQPSANENSAAGYLSQILADKKPASPELVLAWAKTLKLDHDDVAVLRFLAALTYVPEEWHAEMVSLFNRDRTSRGLPAIASEVKRNKGPVPLRRTHRKSRPG